jgi:hypothetical protein
VTQGGEGVFDWKSRQNLDPYYRAVYILQFFAALAMVAGFFLIWWDSPNGDQRAYDLLARSVKQLRERDPAVIGQPLVVLWLLVPAWMISALRGFTGLLVTPVSYRKLALVAWVAALLALGHFYVSYGAELEDRSPLKDGVIDIGFWLTGSSTVLLGALILTEGLIKPRDDPFANQPLTSGPVDDAERIWEGNYQTCPYCGMLNDPQARKCYNCNNLLFQFMQDDKE